VTIVASAPLATGSYTWTVPLSLPRADWKIRATVVGNTLVTSTSAAATTVTWPTVSATVPSSGVAGAPVTVSWAFTDGAVAPVKVRLLQGTRVVATLTSGTATAADGTGSLTSRLPVNLAVGAYQFDVSAAANAAIVQKTGDVAVTLPTLAAAGDTSVVRGQTATFSWTFSDGVAVPVRIDLVQGTKVVLVKTGAVTADAGTGSFAYKAPTTLAAGTYTVRIRPVLLATSTAIQASRTFTVS
jgi:X-X-X-Leu-X-X-Gly heptad repeat protein